VWEFWALGSGSRVFSTVRLLRDWVPLGRTSSRLILNVRAVLDIGERQTVRSIFWNTRRRGLANFIRALVDENDADLLILAENTLPIAALLEELNESEVRWSYAPSLGASNTEVFVRGRDDFVAQLYDLQRMSIRRVLFGRQQAIHLGDCASDLTAMAV